MALPIVKSLSVFLLFVALNGCGRVADLVKYSDNIELFGFGGQLDQSKLVKEKKLPTFTGRSENLEISVDKFSTFKNTSDEGKSLSHFVKNVRDGLLLKRELFEAKLKVIEKDAEVQEAFSDYSPKIKIGTNNNYVLYEQGNNTRMSGDDFMDLFMKIEYPFLDYGRREISTQISLFREKYQHKDLAIKVNELALDLVRIYLDYNSLLRKKLVLENFDNNIEKYLSDAQERFSGGVSNLSEITIAERAKTRHNARIVSFNQTFSKAKIQYSENFLGVASSTFDPTMLAKMSGDLFSYLNEPIFKLDRPSLEQTLLEIEQTIAEYEIARHRADYLPRFTSSVETKAFDIDEYDGALQTSLNLAGEFGLFDGGKSEARIRALFNKADSVRQRKFALQKELETRLNTLRGEIEALDGSINQSTLDLQFHYTKFDEAVERSQQVSFNLSELVSADENILDSTLKLIDQEVELENLWAEVLNIHGIYPDLFEIKFEDVGR